MTAGGGGSRELPCYSANRSDSAVLGLWSGGTKKIKDDKEKYD